MHLCQCNSFLRDFNEHADIWFPTSAFQRSFSDSCTAKSCCDKLSMVSVVLTNSETLGWLSTTKKALDPQTKDRMEHSHHRVAREHKVEIDAPTTSQRAKTTLYLQQKLTNTRAPCRLERQMRQGRADQRKRGRKVEKQGQQRQMEEGRENKETERGNKKRKNKRK